MHRAAFSVLLNALVTTGLLVAIVAAGLSIIGVL